MPQECSKSMSCDSFNEAARAGHKFGPRSSETPVNMGDAKLTAIFNPHAGDGGVHVTNQYPRVESKFRSARP